MNGSLSIFRSNFAGLNIFVVSLLAMPLPVEGAEQSQLYRTATIVTGERDETRYPGIETCFRDVIVKVSSNPELLKNPKFTDLASRARSFAWSYTYHDRLFGKPIADEQGTRDRPFDLTVQFDQKMIV